MKPQKHEERPSWFPRLPGDLQVASFREDRKELVFKDEHSPKKTLRIRLTKRKGPKIFSLYWRIEHYDQVVFSGRLYLSEESLVNAFGLSPFEWERSAKPREYHRERERLSIPAIAPATKDNPNLTLLLTREVKDGVKRLLSLLPV